jgi:hypothetical protein
MQMKINGRLIGANEEPFIVSEPVMFSEPVIAIEPDIDCEPELVNTSCQPGLDPELYIHRPSVTEPVS